MPCIGHILHNAILKSLEHEDIQRVLKLARRIVSLFHSSYNYRTKLKKTQKELDLPQHELVNDVVTRWGSKFKMLSRLKEQMPATNKIFIDDVKYRHLNINWQDALLIDSILSALAGFHTLTDVLSGENEVTISSTVPLLRHIYKLCKIKEDDHDVTCHIKREIKVYISERMKDGDMLGFLRIAEILDPRYLKLSTAEDDVAGEWIPWPKVEEVKAAIVTLGTNVVNARESVPNSDNSKQQQARESKPPESKRKKSVLVSLLTSNPNDDEQDTIDTLPRDQPPLETRIRRELEFYLQLDADSNENVLRWWKEHQLELPNLSAIARYVLSSCATSVASERIFSLAGHIVSKRRNALKPSLVNMLVFLAFNQK